MANSYCATRETGLYYLQSRYYNPTWGRFINADALVSTGQGILGNNMFAYCRNNPVCRIDVTGLYDLDRCEADPLDNELVHEEGGRPGGFQNPSQGPISSPKPSSSPPSSSSNQKLSSPGAAMTLDDAIDTAIDFLEPGYTEAFPTNSGRFVSSDGNRQIRIGVKDIMGAHAGAPHINFDLIGGGRYLSFHLYLMSDVGR